MSLWKNTSYAEKKKEPIEFVYDNVLDDYFKSQESLNLKLNQKNMQSNDQNEIND